jgi:hypothetical protein
MAIIKIRQPVEYSFFQWMNNYPDSGHWKDKERFFIFVKTVCRYNASKWKNPQYLKTRILEIVPHFDIDLLERLLELYNNLIQFNKAVSFPTTQLRPNARVKKDHYIELSVKKGAIQEIEKLIET